MKLGHKYNRGHKEYSFGHNYDRASVSVAESGFIQ